jgi:hypothetical protein
MDAIKLREVRGFDMEEMFSVPPERERETLFTFVGMSENIQAMSESFTLVLNRDIRASVEMASEIAVFLAKKYPERNVMLVNTYAGSDMMQRTLAYGMRECKVPMPPSFRRFFTAPPDFIRHASGYVGPHPDASQDAWFAEGAAPGMKNIRVLDCPISTCTSWRMEAELAITPAQILIVNSFEFGALNHWHRSVLAEGLLELQQKHSLSIVVFSQEMRSDVIPFRKARGPIGVLSANCPAVWKVMSDYERNEWDRKRRLGITHENSRSAL